MNYTLISLLCIATLNGVASAATITSETDVMAPSGAPATRTTIGVGEIVRFTCDQQVEWSATGGEPATGGMGTYTWFAPSEPGTVTITAQPSGYGEASEPVTVTMTVIAPTNLTMTKIANRAGYARGSAGAGFTASVTVHPLSVNFNQIEVQEQEAPPIASGYFVGLAHGHPQGVWRQVDEHNSGFTDEVGITVPGYRRQLKPFTFGLWLWVIPAHYRSQAEAESVGIEFMRIGQLVVMTGPTGTVWAGKAGASAIRSP